MIDVGSYGSESDGRVFAESNLSTSIRENTLNLPKETTNLPGSELQILYFFIADDAFALTETVMKPYSKRHLNEKENIFNLDFLVLDALLKTLLAF